LDTILTHYVGIERQLNIKYPG